MVIMWLLDGFCFVISNLIVFMVCVSVMKVDVLGGCGLVVVMIIFYY